MFPQFGHKQGDCSDKPRPLVVSVTHENKANNHEGSKNYDPDIVSYMADFDYDTDFGRWLDVQLRETDHTKRVSISLDTIAYDKTNVTGWPLRYGHLFTGLGDSSVRANLDKSIFVEVDMRVRADKVQPELYREGYSGRRIMVGAKANWTEAPPRANRAHFIEIDLLQSPGYTESYGDPSRPLCSDRSYDRCFYDPSGKYAEGRELRFHQNVTPKTDGWMHLRIPLSEVVRSLRWASSPSKWELANLEGLYIGIESQGATRTAIELKGYHVYAEDR